MIETSPCSAGALVTRLFEGVRQHDHATRSGRAESIARCVNLYLDDPALRAGTQERALAYGRRMAWPHAGRDYSTLLRDLLPAKD
jgi:hypothetical protein